MDLAKIYFWVACAGIVLAAFESIVCFVWVFEGVMGIVKYVSFVGILWLGSYYFYLESRSDTVLDGLPDGV